MADELIFHHYDTSPFSEKVRLLFGAKGLAWRSVIQPTIMPKPDLVPLTGGYRRIPVMQIGADVFCDTQVIMAELVRRTGDRDLEKGGGFAVNFWADRLFFQPAVAVIFGEIGDNVPKAFKDDREKLSGRPFDTAAMKAAGPPMQAQWRAHAAWIEGALGDQPFLAGDKPAIADFAAYMNIWFMGGAVPQVTDALLAGLERTIAWRARVAAIGHGQRKEMKPADALRVAAAAEPAPYTDHDPKDPLGVQPGDAVKIVADDYGREPIAGALVAANPHRVVIARDDPTLGRVHNHFPRAGYMLMPG
ncbi:MAG TPA: glutathione S-transferase family protein [Caulobacteraceae bacterium]|nr:glutathione S-transferase family protein [Caulobacteraceae bacterium]